MSNNPYQAPSSVVYVPRQEGRLPVEVKRAWNRFARTHRNMRRWHAEGRPEKAKRKMWKWEKLNQEAWAMGFEVPDEFDPTGPTPQMKLRGGQR